MIKRYAGNNKAYWSLIKKMIKQGKTFKLESCGNTHFIYFKRKTYYFYERSNDTLIPQACKDVLRCCRNYFKQNTIDSLPVNIYAKTYASNKFLLTKIINDKVNIVAIDLKACYWNILFKKGILTEKVYHKYLHEKDARLISVGNLKKEKHYKYYIDGIEDVTQAHVVQNRFKIVWDFVVSEAYNLYCQLNLNFGYPVFLFKTDCYYVEESLKLMVCKYLDDNQIQYSTDFLTNIAINENIVTVFSQNRQKEIQLVGLYQSLKKNLVTT